MYEKYFSFNLKIINNFDNCSATNNRILFLCYQPIIGAKSLNFFLTLNEIFNLKSYHCLDKKISLNLLFSNFFNWIEKKNFSNLKSKLESIGLLKTFISEEKKLIIFELFSPATPLIFFNNNLLKNLLLNKVGNYNFEKLLFSFKSVKFSNFNYIDISQNNFFNKIDNNNFFDKKLINEGIYKNLKSYNISQPFLSNENNNKINYFSPEKINFNISQNIFFNNFTNNFLSTNDNKNILHLQNNLKISSKIINLLIYYSLYKNNNQLNWNYIFKICKTLNSLNFLNSFDKIVNHLKNAIESSEFKLSFNLNNSNNYFNKKIKNITNLTLKNKLKIPKKKIKKTIKNEILI